VFCDIAEYGDAIDKLWFTEHFFNGCAPERVPGFFIMIHIQSLEASQSSLGIHQLYVYLEPKWPLFSRFWPIKLKVSHPKEGSFGFQVYIYIYIYILYIYKDYEPLTNLDAPPSSVASDASDGNGEAEIEAWPSSRHHDVCWFWTQLVRYIYHTS